MSVGVKVFAPASVANLACGYDILGLAIEGPGDEVIARIVDKPGLRIAKIVGAKSKLPYEVNKNTAGVAALKLLEHLGEGKLGVELEIIKKMPFGSGLGSSAASAAASVMAINEVLKRPLTRRELLPFAVLGEQVADGAYHADNVAPSLMGGIVFIRSNKELDVHRVPVPKGLYVSVIYPHIKVLTKDSRGILGDMIRLDEHIEQSGNLGGLLLGLFNSNFDLIGRSLKDVIIEPQRAQLIPGFFQVQEAALKEGALGCSISGAGPSIFALSSSKLNAENIGNAMQKVFNDLKIESNLFVSGINQTGTYLI